MEPGIGDSAEWRAIEQNRDRLNKLERGQAVVESQLSDLKSDTRDILRQLPGFKKEVLDSVQLSHDQTNERIDRFVTTVKWALALALPAATAVLSAVLSK